MDGRTNDTTLSVYVVDLATQFLSAGSRVDFTFYWPEADRWEGRDFFVTVEMQR
jgi:glucoamylase